MRIVLPAIAIGLSILTFPLHAIEITCEDPVGNELVYILEDGISIEKNEDYSKTVYSISTDGKITVLESTEGREEDQAIIDKLSWRKLGNGYIGTGFIEVDGVFGVGSLYIDETQELGTGIIDVDGFIVSAAGKNPCRKTR